MMRPITFIFVFIFCSTSFYSKAQSDNFRRDYSYVSVYTDGEWSDSEEGENTFVFNANDRNDIYHYTASGKKYLYRKLSDVEEGTTTGSTAYDYQLVEILDEDGNEAYLQLFEEESIGLKIIFSSDLMISDSRFKKNNI